MNDNPHISVREMKISDIDLLADYWFNSNSQFLKSMGADKRSYALIWELNRKQIGHTNVNNIIFGNEAKMHLHLWKLDNRKKGIGTLLVKKSLFFYFEQEVNRWELTKDKYLQHSL